MFRLLAQRRATWYTLLALAFTGQLLDIITTALAIGAGDHEGNPVVLQLLHVYGLPGVAAAKLALVMALALILAPFLLSDSARRSRLALVGVALLALLVALSMFTAGHNLAYLLALQLP